MSIAQVLQTEKRPDPLSGGMYPGGTFAEPRGTCVMSAAGAKKAILDISAYYEPTDAFRATNLVLFAFAQFPISQHMCICLSGILSQDFQTRLVIPRNTGRVFSCPLAVRFRTPRGLRSLQLRVLCPFLA